MALTNQERDAIYQSIQLLADKLDNGYGGEDSFRNRVSKFFAPLFKGKKTKDEGEGE